MVVMSTALPKPSTSAYHGKQSSEVDFKIDHRRVVRGAELELVVPFIRPGSSVLEVGAGAGWQAKLLASKGYNVYAIDLPSSNYVSAREWNIIEYDGSTIPLGDSAVDVVFSSNVLEHVPHIHEFQKELLRVLKPGGLAIHVMPTSTWRLWTSLSFYVRRLKKGFKTIFKRLVPKKAKAKEHNVVTTIGAKREHPHLPARVANLVLPTRHGVRGNILSEMYYFTEWYWTGVFKRAGWELQMVFPNRIFYSGNRIWGTVLTLPMRRILSRILGSSCKIYLMRKPN